MYMHAMRCPLEPTQHVCTQPRFEAFLMMIKQHTHYSGVYSRLLHPTGVSTWTTKHCKLKQTRTEPKPVYTTKPSATNPC